MAAMVIHTEIALQQSFDMWMSAKYKVKGKLEHQENTTKRRKQADGTHVTYQTPLFVTSYRVELRRNTKWVDVTRNDDGVIQTVSTRTGSQQDSGHYGDTFAQDFEEDVTLEALQYEQVMVWNERVSYIESTSCFIFQAPGRDPIQVTSDRDIGNTMSIYSPLALSQWLQHTDCSRFHAIGFYPKLNPTPEEFPARDFNLFRGMRIPQEKATDGDCEPLLNHIHEIICCGNEEHSTFFLNCLAQMVQTPWRKLNTATVLISEEGAGKSIIFQHFMAKILGPQCFLSESRADALFGTYNGCLSGKVCVVAEELLWAGNHRDAGILKDMLTSETLSLNDKYQKRWCEQNFANVFVLTNNSWAIQASMHARRFFVLNPKDVFSGKQTVAARDYFDKLLAVDPAAFAYHLYNRDLTGFNSRQPPLTEALESQKKISMTPLETVIHECLQREYVITEYLFGDVMPRTHVYDEIVKEFGNRIRNFPQSPQLFWSELRKCLTAKDGECLLTDAYNGKRQQSDGIRDRWVQLPHLELCREWWNKNKFAEGWGQGR
jgi:hypothetical protein